MFSSYVSNHTRTLDRHGVILYKSKGLSMYPLTLVYLLRQLQVSPDRKLLTDESWRDSVAYPV